MLPRRTMRKSLALLLSLGSFAACVDPDAQTRTTPRPPGEHPRGTYVIRDPGEQEGVLRFGPGPQRRIVYMNRFGGTFQLGDDNSGNNTSSIPMISSSTLQPFGDGDAAWQDLMTCVRQMFGPYDVTITETDPGATPHIESVVAGDPEDIGHPAGSLLGIATMFSDCSVVEEAIVFTFPG